MGRKEWRKVEEDKRRYEKQTKVAATRIAGLLTSRRRDTPEEVYTFPWCVERCGVWAIFTCLCLQKLGVPLQPQPMIHLTDLISQFQSVETTTDYIVKWIDVSCHVTGHMTFYEVM